MLKKMTKAICSVALLALATNALASKGEQWLTDMDEAQKVAQAEGKDIFMFFTGSDWCGWCIKLDNEVLAKEEFLAYAKDNLVLVDLDFPSADDIITEEQLAHNEKWKEVFKPRGYPTVYLTDASAKAYAQTGYQAGGPVKYVEHVQSLIAGKAAMAEMKAKAAKATGLTRAKLLDEILNLEGVIIENTDELESEILKLSKADKELNSKYVGIKANKDLSAEMRAKIKRDGEPEENLKAMLEIFDKYSFIKEGGALHSLLGRLGDQFIKTGKADEGVAFMDGVVTNDSYPLEIQQKTALFKGIITANVGEGEGNYEKSIEFYDMAVAMDPESQTGQRAKRMKQQMSEKAAAES